MEKILIENIIAIVKSFYYLCHHFIFIISILKNIQDSFMDNYLFSKYSIKFFDFSKRYNILNLTLFCNGNINKLLFSIFLTIYYFVIKLKRHYI